MGGTAVYGGRVRDSRDGLFLVSVHVRGCNVLGVGGV